MIKSLWNDHSDNKISQKMSKNLICEKSTSRKFYKKPQIYSAEKKSYSIFKWLADLKRLYTSELLLQICKVAH